MLTLELALPDAVVRALEKRAKAIVVRTEDTETNTMTITPKYDVPGYVRYLVERDVKDLLLSESDEAKSVDAQMEALRQQKVALRPAEIAVRQKEEQAQ